MFHVKLKNIFVADKTTNKMIIPKFIIEQWGNQFYMEIYEDKIILKPIKKEK